MPRLMFRSGMLAAALLLLGLGGCSDDDSPAKPQPADTYRLVAPLENALVDVPLSATQSSTFTLTLQLPPDIPRVAAVEIDVAATLDQVQLNGISLWDLIARKAAKLLGRAEDFAATASFRVGSDPDTVCETGIYYGPFEASFGTGLVVSPESATADAGTLEIINAGTIFICMTITPNFNAELTVDALALDITEAPCNQSQDFSGTWTGTYQCFNSCTGPEGGAIQLDIDQDGDDVTYTDSLGDSFVGKVCGDMVRFEHVGTDFIERGTLTLTGPNTAIKRSTWRSQAAPYCGGNCQDTLTRQTGGGDCPAITITSGDPPNGAVGQSYYFQLTATGGYGSLTRWLMPEDFIPGLDSYENGVLSGTPEVGTAGTYTLTATVYDMCPTDIQLVTRTYTITITD